MINIILNWIKIVQQLYQCQNVTITDAISKAYNTSAK